MLYWTLGCIFLFKLVFLFYLNMHPGVELLDNVVELFLIFEGHPYFFPQWLCQFTFSPSAMRVPFFSWSSTVFVISCLSLDSHSKRGEVVSHHGFDLHFSEDLQCKSFFFFFFLLRLYSQHMEVPRLGVESELQLPAYSTATATSDPNHVCNLHHSSRQCQFLNPLSEPRDRTWILREANQIHFHWAMTGTPQCTPFHMPVGHLYVFLGKMSLHVFYPFLIELFAFWYWVVWAVYIFWVLNPY